MRFFALQSSFIPWGDYGHVLQDGIATRSKRTGLLQVQRTGPFVPPISLPFMTVVVTADLKTRLGESGLVGAVFQQAVKEHIVHLEWEKWDRNADEPAEYPETGEPEDYILARPHSPETAAHMPALWELCLKNGAEGGREGDRFDPTLYIVGSSWDGSDFFTAHGLGYRFVSERAKEWLEREVGQWVSFQEFLVK